MLTTDWKRLLIFEDFRVDLNLPKFRKPSSLNEEEDEDMGVVFANSSVQMSRSRRVRFNQGVLSVVEDPDSHEGPDLTLPQRLFAFLLDWVSPPGRKLLPSPSRREAPKEEARSGPSMSVEEFFSGVKDSGEALTVVQGRIEGYQAALQRAHQTGQTALREALEAGVEAVRSETRLMALGVTKIISEETLVKFVKKSPKGLRLDWVCNFTRHIPDDVLEIKVKCDEEGCSTTTWSSTTIPTRRRGLRLMQRSRPGETPSCSASSRVATSSTSWVSGLMNSAICHWTRSLMSSVETQPPSWTPTTSE